MLDAIALQGTGSFITLQDAVRLIVQRRGGVGQSAAKKWLRNPDPPLHAGEALSTEALKAFELTPDEEIELELSAHDLFAWLQEGKLKSLHRSDKREIRKKIARSTWRCCEYDNVRWDVSAIRAQHHTPMFEDITVNATDFDHLISQTTTNIEKSNFSTVENKSLKQQFVLIIVK